MTSANNLNRLAPRYSRDPDDSLFEKGQTGIGEYVWSSCMIITEVFIIGKLPQITYVPSTELSKGRLWTLISKIHVDKSKLNLSVFALDKN